MNRHLLTRLDGATLACRYTPGFMRAYALPDDIFAPEDYLLKTVVEPLSLVKISLTVMRLNVFCRPAHCSKAPAEASGVKLVYTPLHVKRCSLSSTKNNSASSLSDVQIAAFL
ncbi:hypothetical protein KCP73_14205 [Salmonella enterica subsp. enterica]|nr:hypothetical protein KCP73_14205 [Salmonella enterica subsp. enterica]